MGLCNRVTGFGSETHRFATNNCPETSEQPIGDSHPHSRVRINSDAWNLTPEASHSSAQADGLSF
jgi:hypothetical protein